MKIKLELRIKLVEDKTEDGCNECVFLKLLDHCPTQAVDGESCTDDLKWNQHYEEVYKVSDDER